MLLLICHQSMKVLHFLNFKTKFLLTKLIFPGLSRNQSYHLMIVAFLVLRLSSLSHSYPLFDQSFHVSLNIDFLLANTPVQGFVSLLHFPPSRSSHCNQTSLQCLELLHPIHPLPLPLYTMHVFPHHHFLKAFHQEI